MIDVGQDADEWVINPPGTVYRCEVHLRPRADGSFHVIAARVPSLTADGATVEEAKASIHDRLVEWLKAQKVTGTVRWAEGREPEPGELVRAIAVSIG